MPSQTNGAEEFLAATAAPPSPQATDEAKSLTGDELLEGRELGVRFSGYESYVDSSVALLRAAFLGEGRKLTEKAAGNDAALFERLSSVQVGLACCAGLSRVKQVETYPGRARGACRRIPQHDDHN